MTPRVVLFDLDGTVLTFQGSPPGPGRTALELAMRELYAVERATDGIRVAGGTDRALARAMLQRARAADDEAAIARVLATYVVHLEAVLGTRRYEPIGDVGGVVETLQARGAVVGVATGNTRDGARLKLASAGLGATFDMARGAYGCDAEARDEIVRLAARRCGAGAGAPASSSWVTRSSTCEPAGPSAPGSWASPPVRLPAGSSSRPAPTRSSRRAATPWWPPSCDTPRSEAP